MLYFQPWKVLTILVVCALGVILSAPNLFNAATLEGLPSWIPHKQISLGLDLQGGSHLLLEVDMNSVIRERLNAAVDSARTELRNARIGYTGLAIQGNQVVLTVRDLDKLDDVRTLAKKIDPELDAAVTPDGKVTLTYNEAALAARERTILDQSIEIVRRRIDQLGTKEPTIQREGADRILVQLPGLADAQHAKDVIKTTAKLTFQLVDSNVSVEEAKRVLPPGDEILPSAEDSRHPGVTGPSYVVQRHVLVSGDALTDAQATFQDGQPVVSFKFDANGGRRFGEVTKANVGKPFAIVLDGKVISAPVIREA